MMAMPIQKANRIFGSEKMSSDDEEKDDSEDSEEEEEDDDYDKNE